MKIKIYPNLKLNIITFSVLLFLFSACDDFLKKGNLIKTKSGYKEYIFTENGDSIVVNYNKHKNKTSEYMFKNGYFDGQAYTYYENGKVQYDIQYKNGYKHGIVKWFFENGTLYRETNYDMGERNGIQKKYYKSGALLAEIPYENDEVQYGLKEYYEDGSQNLNLPIIKIKEIDKTVFEDKIILEVYLDPKAYKIQYFLIEERSGKEYEYSLKKHTEKNKAHLEYKVYPGEIEIREIKLKAIAKTKLGNPIVLNKTYKLVAENKM